MVCEMKIHRDRETSVVQHGEGKASCLRFHRQMCRRSSPAEQKHLGKPRIGIQGAPCT